MKKCFTLIKNQKIKEVYREIIMKIFMKYIIRNILQITSILLLSIFFVFLIFPALFRFNFIRSILNKPLTNHLIAITALILFFLILSWKRIQELFQRYKNTYNLKKLSLIWVDYIVLFIFFSVLLIILFQNKYTTNVSYKFCIFLLVNLFFILIWILSSYYWKIKRENQTTLNKDKYSLFDEPIKFIEQDLLGREKFIEDLQKEIKSLPFDNSFIFGLYGSWGEGKTSVINLLINKFMKNDNFLIVNFDPWNFKDEEAILLAFYNQMEQSISRKFIIPDSKKTFIKYQNLISMGLSQAGIKIDFSDTKESIKEIKQRIESYITQTKKKIIIFIDDIDRLQPNEILLVFKLVRLSANFKNTIFLLAFDQTVVQNYFESNLKIDSEFLEKIVQKSIPLPAIEQQDIDQFLYNHIDKLFDELVISKGRRDKFEKDFQLIYQTQVKKIFKTLRRAKRYLNGLRSTLPSIKNEVNLNDFLILEIIRNFFPRIYDDIWVNPWSYLATKWDIGYYFSSPFALNIEDDKKYEIIKEHIESITKNEKDGELVKNLLKELFFEVEDSLDQNKLRLGQKDSDKTYRIEKRITNPECFKKYFMLKVLSSDISDEFIEATLDLWHSIKDVERENVISKTIFELQEKLILPKFFNKLKVFIEKIPKEVAYDIIKVIYRNAGEFSKKGAGNFESSEYLNSINLLLSLVNNKIEKDKIHSILEETVMNTPCIYSAVLVVGFCQKRGGGSFYNIYESANLDKLQNEVANRLKKYFVDEKRDIFKEVSGKDGGWIFVSYQWGSNWGSFEGDNNKIVNDYVLSLIKDNAKKFITFLASQREVTFSDVLVFNLKEISRIYNLSELNKLAEKFKDNPTLPSKEKETIEIFLKTYQDFKNNE